MNANNSAKLARYASASKLLTPLAPNMRLMIMITILPPSRTGNGSTFTSARFADRIPAISNRSMSAFGCWTTEATSAAIPTGPCTPAGPLVGFVNNCAPMSPTAPRIRFMARPVPLNASPAACIGLPLVFTSDPSDTPRAPCWSPVGMRNWTEIVRVLPLASATTRSTFSPAWSSSC